MSRLSKFPVSYSDWGYGGGGLVGGSLVEAEEQRISSQGWLSMTSCVCFTCAVGLGLETEDKKESKNANALMEYRKVFLDRARQEIPVFFFFYLFKENKII